MPGARQVSGLFDNGAGREALLRGIEGIHQADAVEWLRSLPPESIDLIVTDPAYESLEKHRAKGTTTRLSHWFPVFPNGRYPELFEQFWRVLRRGTHLYILCDETTRDVLKPIGEAAGFTFWRTLIWDFVHIGMGYHYRGRCGRVMFFEKGKRKLNDLGMADILTHPRVHNGFPTEKPVSLFGDLIRQSTSLEYIGGYRDGCVPTYRPLVVDPFMGSGACGEAALKLGRRFGGCDISDAAVKRSRERLATWL